MIFTLHNIIIKAQSCFRGIQLAFFKKKVHSLYSFWHSYRVNVSQQKRNSYSFFQHQHIEFFISCQNLYKTLEHCINTMSEHIFMHFYINAGCLCVKSHNLSRIMRKPNQRPLLSHHRKSNLSTSESRNSKSVAILNSHTARLSQIFL